MRRLALALALCLVAPGAARAQWQPTSGTVPHNHTNISGDGGQLSNFTPIGTTSLSTTNFSGPVTLSSPTVVNASLSITAPVVMTSSSVQVSSGIVIGDNAGANRPAIYIPALSMDGATEAAGCLVLIEDTGSGQITFTSTTTSQAVGKLGILSQATNPGSVGLVQVYGRALVTETGASTVGDSVITTTTRCQGSRAGLYSSNSPLGIILKSTGGAGAAPVWLY